MTWHDDVAAFAAGDIQTWPGLRLDTRLSDLESILSFDPTCRLPGWLGDPASRRRYVEADTDVYADGLRIWIEDGTDPIVLALEGLVPVTASGEPVSSPDTGVQILAERGLETDVALETAVVLRWIGFIPTSEENYRATVRPIVERSRPHPIGGRR